MGSPPGLAQGVVVTPWGAKARYRRSNDRPADLDIAARRGDILKLAKAIGAPTGRPGPLWCLLTGKLGWDQDDLHQEIIAWLIHKQALPGSRYDPERASAGKYLWTAIQSIMRQLAEKAETDSRGGRGGRSAVEVGLGHVLEGDPEPDEDDTLESTLQAEADIVLDLRDFPSELRPALEELCLGADPSTIPDAERVRRALRAAG